MLAPGKEGYVSIVPLWNWNTAVSFTLFSSGGLNRTFMELKLPTRLRTRHICARLNRTFMELKWLTVIWSLRCRMSQSYLYGIEITTSKVAWWLGLVSIVPLWNWNNISYTDSLGVSNVSIVPLWNWNAWHISQQRLIFFLSQSYLYGIEILASNLKV